MRKKVTTRKNMKQEIEKFLIKKSGECHLVMSHYDVIDDTPKDYYDHKIAFQRLNDVFEKWKCQFVYDEYKSRVYEAPTYGDILIEANQIAARDGDHIFFEGVSSVKWEPEKVCVFRIAMGS